MADENTINPADINAVTKSVAAGKDAIDDMLKDARKLNRAMEDSADDTNKAFKGLLSTLTRITRGVRPAIREFDKFSDIANNAEKGVLKLAKGFDTAFYKGNKQAMIATNALASSAVAMATVSRQAEITSNKLDFLAANFRDTEDGIQKTEKSLSELSEEQKKYNAIIKAGGTLSEEQKFHVVQIADQMDIYKGKLVDAYEKSNNLATSAEVLTEDLREQRDMLISLNKETLANVRYNMQQNREARKMAGGWAAISAAAEEVVDSKLFRDLSLTGLAVGSLALITKSLSQISDHAKATSRIALSLGDTSQVGFGRMADSTAEARKETMELTALSHDLGYEMEDVNNAMNKVRSSIRLDKEGRLTSQAIREMTKEAAYFARISGMELNDAVGLLETRIHRYGMTSAQATADLQSMRMTIMQMTAGTKNALIPMGEMVNIIEEASAASQSYIVDTRIMTSALRGAVNQAEHLGVAQKQAKDVAQGVGKILSGAPDFIKIPAGFSLVDQLLGKDSDKILSTLDAGTRKQVKSIQESLRAGKLDYYVGAKALMDLIGQTDAGIEAQSKKLEETILMGPQAAALIAEQYGIENTATAVMITQMMQEASEMRNRINANLGEQKLSFATALVKDTAMINDAIMKAEKADKEDVLALMGKEQISRKEAEQRILDAANKNLSMQGLGKQQMVDYKAALLEGNQLKLDNEKKIQELKNQDALGNAQEIAALELEIFRGTHEKQQLLLKKMRDPVRAMIDDLKGPIKYDAKGNIVIDAAAMKQAGIESGKALAESLGGDYATVSKDLQQELEKMAKNGATDSELKAMRQGVLSANDAAMKAANQRASGLMSYLEYPAKWLGDIASSLGPGGKIVAGLAGLAATLYILHRGQTKNVILAAKLMEGPIYRNVLKALLITNKDPRSKLLPSGDGAGGADKPGIMSKIGGLIKRNPKKAAAVVVATAAAAYGAYKYSSSDEEEEEEKKEDTLPKEPTEINNQENDSGSGAMGATVGAVSTLRATSSMIPKAMLPKLGMMGKGAKALSAVPLLGTAIGGYYAYQQATELYKKWKEDPNSITPSDKIKMVTALGTMVPGIGSYVAMSDMAMEMGGGYDKLDTALASSASAGGLAGTPTPMPEPAKTQASNRTRLAQLGGDTGATPSLTSDVNLGSLTPDGALTLKVRGMYDILAQFMKAKAATA